MLKRKWLFNPHTIGYRKARPPAGAASLRMMETSWETNKLTWLMDLKSRKSRICCCVGPLEPAAIILRTTWSDKGENTMLSDFSKEKSCLATQREKFSWLVFDSQMEVIVVVRKLVLLWSNQKKCNCQIEQLWTTAQY